MTFARIGTVCAATSLLGVCGFAVAQDKPASAPPAPATPAVPPKTNFIRPAPKEQRQTPVRPFNSTIDVRTAIDEAIKRAATDNKRVLVFWGDNASVWGPRLLEHVQIPSISTPLLFYYEVVWADIADATIGPINKAICQSYGGKGVPDMGGKAMPYFTIIESIGENAGKAVVSRSSKGLEDKEKAAAGQYDFDPILLQDFLLENKREPLVAIDILNKAKETAKQRGLPLFLNFDEVGDGWCVRFRSWLAKPEIRAILDKYVVVTRIDTNRMADGYKLMVVFAGDHAQTIPWYLFADTDDKRLAPVVDSADDNLGFPTGDEIPRFVGMFKKVCPKMTDAEVETLTASLRAETEPKPVGKQ